MLTAAPASWLQLTGLVVPTVVIPCSESFSGGTGETKREKKRVEGWRRGKGRGEERRENRMGDEIIGRKKKEEERRG